MNKLLIMQILNQDNYGYNPEYENLTEEEKKYLDYVYECTSETDENFSNACTKTMFLILEVLSKMDTDEELSNEEVDLKKEEIFLGFNQDDKDKIEMFMYACIQTMGIYSDERIEERRSRKSKILSKKGSKKTS